MSTHSFSKRKHIFDKEVSLMHTLLNTPESLEVFQKYATGINLDLPIEISIGDLVLLEICFKMKKAGKSVQSRINQLTDLIKIIYYYELGSNKTLRDYVGTLLKQPTYIRRNFPLLSSIRHNIEKQSDIQTIESPWKLQHIGNYTNMQYITRTFIYMWVYTLTFAEGNKDLWELYRVLFRDFFQDTPIPEYVKEVSINEYLGIPEYITEANYVVILNWGNFIEALYKKTDYLGNLYKEEYSTSASQRDIFTGTGNKIGILQKIDRGIFWQVLSRIITAIQEAHDKQNNAV